MSDGYRIQPGNPLTCRLPGMPHPARLVTGQRLPLPVIPPARRSGQAASVGHAPSVLSAPGGRIPAFIWQFYNRVIAIPEVLSAGSISTTLIQPVCVWNATLEPVRLCSQVFTGNEGMTLTGPSVPLPMNRLGLARWTLTVTMNGPDVINSQITWLTESRYQAVFTLTGRRSVPWLLLPQDDVTETLSWKTDILASQNGAEQRIARRLSPRRTLEFQVMAAGSDRQRLEADLFHFGSRVWSVPVFMDVASLAQPIPPGALSLPLSPRGRDILPGSNLLLRTGSGMTDDTETVEVSALDDTSVTLKRPVTRYWPAGTRLYPLRSALLTDMPVLTRKTDGVATAQVRFRFSGHQDVDDSHVPPPVRYRGFPVLEPGSDWSEDLTGQYTRLLAEFDSDSGVATQMDLAGRAFTLQRHHWLMAGRETQTALRALFYQLCGRQRPVWVGSQCSDFTPLSMTGSVMTIMACGISRFGPRPGRQDIRIETGKGVYYRRLISAAAADGATEHLTLDGEGLVFVQRDFLKVSWLTLCRMDSDDIAWKHITDADGAADITVNFRGVRDELE
ncbi:TPA: phage tail protein [Klebsiella oxytoca]|uniref:Phage tail protein n=1 Tax=Klebsiella oxytoca TaxID=571 RepID=A0AAN5LBH6_KLEOX|nr:phage tail protein [Klebsiella oxytoca]